MFKQSRWLRVVMPAFVLSGCVVSTPFKGPGYEPGKGVTLADVDTVQVAITHAVLNKDKILRSRFWAHLDNVEITLEDRNGFIGYSKRTKLFGNEAWTMSAWADEESLNAFVHNGAHLAAMQQAMIVLEKVRTTRVSLNKDQIPLSWDKALALLETQTRRQY